MRSIYLILIVLLVTSPAGAVLYTIKMCYDNEKMSEPLAYEAHDEPSLIQQLFQAGFNIAVTDDNKTIIRSKNASLGETRLTLESFLITKSGPEKGLLFFESTSGKTRRDTLSLIDSIMAKRGVYV